MTDDQDYDMEAVEHAAIATERAKELQVKRPKPKPAFAPLVPRTKREANKIFQSKVQKFLRGQDPSSPDPRTRLDSELEALHQRAIDRRSGQGAKATELLWSYAYDKPKPAPDELDAMKKGGFQVVFVERGGLEGVERREALPPAPKPEFIDAEIVEDDNVK